MDEPVINNKLRIISSWQLIYKCNTPPRIRVEHFKQWQAEVFLLMNNRSSLHLNSDRVVNIIYDKDGGSGKTCFFSALNHEQPKRFLFIPDIPKLGMFISTIIEARRTGWTGDTIIFDIGHRKHENQICYRTLEMVKDGFYLPACCNIWIFTSEMLDIMKVPGIHWNISKIFGNREKNIISSLEPLTLLQAEDIFNKEKTSQDN